MKQSTQRKPTRNEPRKELLRDILRGKASVSSSYAETLLDIFIQLADKAGVDILNSRSLEKDIELSLRKACRSKDPEFRENYDHLCLMMEWATDAIGQRAAADEQAGRTVEPPARTQPPDTDQQLAALRSRLEKLDNGARPSATEDKSNREEGAAMRPRPCFM